MLSPRMCEDSQRLSRAAGPLDWKVVRWADWRVPEGLPETDLVLYAAPLFAERVSQLLPIDFPEPDDRWLTKLDASLLNRKVEATTLAEARQIRERSFFKPASFKTFRAGVYESGAELPEEDKADGDNPVLVSEVVVWESEFRFFMLDGKALTGSVYFRFGESAEGNGEWPCGEEEFAQARETAERAYADCSEGLPAGVVIDTGYIQGSGWSVIEANPAWGSGLYGSEAVSVLKVLEKTAVSR